MYTSSRNEYCRKGALLLFNVVMSLVLALGIIPANNTVANAKTAFNKTKPVGLVTTAVGTKVAITWEKLAGAEKYLVYEAETIHMDPAQGPVPTPKFTKIKTTKAHKLITTVEWRGADYKYYVVATKTENGKTVKSKKSDIRTTTIPRSGKSTIKNLLRAGIAPIGSTMYIWGGGWTGQELAGGKMVHSTGISAKWRQFAAKQGKKYNYQKHKFKRNLGLDCSGFVGYCVYNVMETQNGMPSYVTFASQEGKMYAKKGFGTYVAANKVKDRKAGDIMTSSGHVWISLGECSDGSAVVLHASPPVVGMAGTASKTGKSESKAVKLVRKYMKKYYPDLYKKYPNSIYRGSYYNTSYGRMRWNDKTLKDPEGYRRMSAEQVMKDLFEER